MRIGHIDLSPHISAAEEQLVILVEALTAHNLEQHILVRNPFLAKRLAVCGGVPNQTRHIGRPDRKIVANGSDVAFS